MTEEYNYTAADLEKQIKPLSKNGFLRFFQKIGRWWLSHWYGFEEKHPKASSILYKVFFLIVFSEGVTIFQYLVMTFLPQAFGGLNNGVWGWPNTPLKIAGDVPYIIFGDAKGLGYFIAFELAMFLAQCINFPLQRNITYRSHGNPWYQAMWYFIGWALISVFVNAVWGFVNCFMIHWGWNDALAGVIKTIITGGISMVIFFFIFMIIFPDNKAAAKRAKVRLDKWTAEQADADKLAEAKAAYEKAEKAARKSETEKAEAQAVSLAGAKAMKYFAVVKAGKAAEGTPEETEYRTKIAACYRDAVEALKAKEKAIAEKQTVWAKA